MRILSSIARHAVRNMSVKLNDGTSIPAIGFGAGTAWYGRKGVDQALVGAVLTALKAGYVHLDLAEAYGNEPSIGAALKQWNGKREDLYITEKILGGMPDIEGTLKRQLSDLGIDYVDLYLLHAPEKIWPKGSPSQEEAWKQLEELQKEGLTKSIGISNHRVEDIERVLKSGNIVPAVNQIELHPYIYKEAKAIIDLCHSKGIAIEAYSPTATLTSFTEGPVTKVVEEIASKLGVTPGQVLLKWAAKKGNVVLTTSSKESRMKEQLTALSAGGDLSAEDVRAIEEAGLSYETKRKYMANVFE